MNKLLVLKTIVELNSFTKAAEKLGYTQSAISQLISSLEDEYNIKILKRSRNGINLTSEGEKIYPDILQTINSFSILEEKVKNINGLKTGTVKIGAITSVSSQWLPKLFKEFQKKYPSINFDLHQGDYGYLIELIKNEKVDFALMTENYGDNLEKIFLKNTEMKVYLPKNHKLSNLKTVPIEKLIKDPFILIEGGGYSEPLQAFQKSNLSPNVKYNIQDDYTIMSMIESGLGISILSELVINRTDFNIIAKSVNPKIIRPVSIVCKDKNIIPIASKTFIKFLIDKKDTLN